MKMGSSSLGQSAAALTKFEGRVLQEPEMIQLLIDAPTSNYNNSALNT